MHKNKKGTVNIWAIAVVGILFIAAITGAVIYGYGQVQQTAVETTQKTAEIIKTTGAKNLLQKSAIEFKFDAYDGANAQDNESDLDFDLFYWDADKQAELEAQGYVDCSGAVPYELSHDRNKNELPESAFCELNTYKMTQSFTVGNTETNFQEYLSLVQADVTSSSGDSGTRTTDVIETGRTILVTMAENAVSDMEDVVPKAFLITLSNETLAGEETIAQIITGNSPVQLQYRYNAFAGNHSRITFSGECDYSDS